MRAGVALLASVALLSWGCQTTEWDPEVNRFQQDHARCYDAATGIGPDDCRDCDSLAARLHYENCMLALGWTRQELAVFAPSF